MNDPERHEEKDAPRVLWRPNQRALERSPMARFRQFSNKRNALCLGDYDALWHWSVARLDEFWATIWDFYDLNAVSDYSDVLAGDAMPGYRWFTGARLNFAKYLLEQGDADDLAITDIDESGNTNTLNRAELRRQVLGLAATLRDLGVGRGDIVAGYLPNTHHAVVAVLAVAWLGAIWAGAGQDYSATAVVDRFGQLEPVLLFAADGYSFNGKSRSRVDAVTDAVAGLPTVRHVVIVSILGAPTEYPSSYLAWTDAIVSESAAPTAASTEFSDPLWVLFSSGTTGKPKGLVHGHGGVLVEMLKVMNLHMDVRPGTRLFQYTSPSWMMWNIQVAALAMGADIVCYDGSPMHNRAAALWKIVEQTQATYLGVSPGYLQACAQAGLEPAQDFDLSTLEGMGCTGSPLSANVHVWAHDHVGVFPLNPTSGGTDVVSGFFMGAPLAPVWAGEMSVRALGVAVESWDVSGNPVATGEMGELVITQPMPSMPLQIWGDADGSRQHDAYFDTYPGIWRHGDWVTLTERGTAILHGRSDATLNRHGVRMGSGDIYSVVEAIPGIREALVVGIDYADGSYWMPMFVVTDNDQKADAAMRERVASQLRKELSPRHVPDDIFGVSGIPHTKTGKKLEVPVKKILMGKPVDDVVSRAAVDEPALLDGYAEIAHARDVSNIF